MKTLVANMEKLRRSRLAHCQSAELNTRSVGAWLAGEEAWRAFWVAWVWGGGQGRGFGFLGGGGGGLCWGGAAGATGGGGAQPTTAQQDLLVSTLLPPQLPHVLHYGKVSPGAQVLVFHVVYKKRRNDKFSLKFSFER